MVLEHLAITRWCTNFIWTLYVKMQEDCLDLASIAKDLLNLEGPRSLCDLLVCQDYEKDAFRDCLKVFSSFCYNQKIPCLCRQGSICCASLSILSAISGDLINTLLHMSHVAFTVQKKTSIAMQVSVTLNVLKILKYLVVSINKLPSD